MKNDPDKLARVLKVLAVGTRVRIVQLLRERTLCVNALAARLDVTQGAVSQHLRVMRDADLVIDERRGYRVHYRLNEETLEQWRTDIDVLLAPLDQGSTDTTTDEQGDRPCAAMRRNKDA
jgi:DNA-binding transcriptional ArsR family regulator